MVTTMVSTMVTTMGATKVSYGVLQLAMVTAVVAPWLRDTMAHRTTDPGGAHTITHKPTARKNALMRTRISGFDT